MRRLTSLLAFAPFALAAACSDAEPRTLPSADEGPAPATAATIPDAEPAIRGVVTAAVAGTLRVETNPADDSGSPKALVRLTPDTDILFRASDPVDPAELTVGHNVSVWFTGPVAESYPVQATASAVVIEPAGIP